MVYRKFTILIVMLSILLIVPVEGGEKVIEDSQIINADLGIVIDGNIALANASNGVGYGNSTHPYILNYILSGFGNETMLTIKNTNYNFILQNSSITGGTWGIVLDNVNNGNISTSTIQGNTDGGILLTNTNSSYVHNNMIYNNKAIGVCLTGSHNNDIYSNEVYYHNGSASTTTLCPGADTVSLSLNQHGNGGGFLDDPSNNNEFYDNYVHDNAMFGLKAMDSTELVIRDNTFDNNFISVVFSKMTFSYINGNIIINNDQYGIYILESANITIAGNTMSGNLLGDVFGYYTSISTTTSTTISTEYITSKAQPVTVKASPIALPSIIIAIIFLSATKYFRKIKN